MSRNGGLVGSLLFGGQGNADYLAAFMLYMEHVRRVVRSPELGGMLPPHLPDVVHHVGESISLKPKKIAAP